MKHTIFVLFLAAAVCMGCLTGCGNPQDNNPPPSSQQPAPVQTGNATITVATSYGQGDGNHGNYMDSVREWEERSGNTVVDRSVTSNEEWKAQVLSEFEAGNEPDVLFFFTNTDSNPFVEAGKVVPVEEIRQQYPDYGSNMRDEVVPVSPVDGRIYALPTTGVWEGMFANVAVLEDCGVKVPGPDYTWEQFLVDCEIIKRAGYIPIGASLSDVPHYWFEFVVYNNGNAANHRDVPIQDAAGHWDATGEKWMDGFEDLKELYDRGFFPENTLTASDSETLQLVAEGKAAFLIDGSWRIGYFMDDYGHQLENYTITYVPGKGEREASDIVAGITMGYYITRKGWDNPETRDAAVDFIMHMTSDEVITRFVITEVTALKEAPRPSGLNSLQQAASDMCSNATAIAGFAQDEISSEARAELFANVPHIVTGQITASQAIASALALD